ncbi:MAG: SMK killer toxin resistance protein [Piccolia ochrophora]|nr:MAG: SMK killer toxin resistance protein [Piccolia ochrophora]
MASFMEDLLNSIFTPGPTHSLLIATNVSFAALQFVLAILLFMTKSIHFIVLSFLSAALWLAINWFAKELQQAKAEEEAADRTRRKLHPPGSGASSPEDTETEVEAVPPTGASGSKDVEHPALARAGELKKRRSLGESGEMSTEDEWEKVSEGGLKEQ